MPKLTQPAARPVEKQSAWASDDMEATVCPWCGPIPGVKIRFDFDPFKVVVCRKCSLTFLSPRLTEAHALQIYQGEDYFRSSVPGQGYDEYMGASANWLKTFSLRLRAIHHYRSTGRVLDVGCGPGFFMEAAAQMGYDIWGIDPSKYIVSVAQGKFGARVQEAMIATADFGSQSFDIIGAFDTFEHVYDPIKFLTAAHSLLKPGGLLAITTPDSASWLARASGRRWVSFKIPEHVFYWSPVTIRRALDGQFQVLEITRAGQYATLSFLLRRLLGARQTGFASTLMKLLGRLSVYADNGSLTVIAAKV